MNNGVHDVHDDDHDVDGGGGHDRKLFQKYSHGDHRHNGDSHDNDHGGANHGVCRILGYYQRYSGPRRNRKCSTAFGTAV